MRILFLSMHYKPEPCDTRTSVLAREFAHRGHEATVLTSFPNYPFGKTYDGYTQKVWQREQIDGVNVLRVPMAPNHSMSVKRRALSYLSFGASASLIGSLIVGKPELLWIHHPPLTTGVAGFLIAKLKRVPYIYEIHDLWPETLVSTGTVGESWLTRRIRRCCQFLERRASAVVVTSPGMKSHLVAQGLDREKVHVIPQWADEEALAPRERDEDFGVAHGLKGKFNIVFTGNIGAAQGGETILQAARLLQEMSDVQFVFVGAGALLDALHSQSVAMGLKNVKFLGQFQKEEVPSFFAWADALLVTLKDDRLFTITIPSKAQAYLYAGRPILCGVAGDTAEVVERAGAGLTFPPEDARAMAQAVCDLHALPEQERRRLGENGRAAYDAHFSTRQLSDVYEDLFQSVLGRKEARTEEPQFEMSRPA